MINLTVNVKCQCVKSGEVAAVVEGGSRTVPAKDAKQQMEYHCFLLPVE